MIEKLKQSRKPAPHCICGSRTSFPEAERQDIESKRVGGEETQRAASTRACLQTCKSLQRWPSRHPAWKGTISLTWNCLPSYTLSPSVCKISLPCVPEQHICSLTEFTRKVHQIWFRDKLTLWEERLSSGKTLQKTFFIGLKNEIYYNKGKGGSTVASSGGLLAY